VLLPCGLPPTSRVISPLLANIYLHELDRRFLGEGGPKRFANARIVRYADDFVIQARYMGKRITDFVAVAPHVRFDEDVWTYGKRSSFTKGARMP
jgi:retron-type reverse transcriptase